MKNEYLLSKPRYAILDGLRGIGALTVIICHCFETYNARIGTQIINHGYLAVDFFFVLSGFVIGYAYDDRWDKMTTWGFFKRRLVRLHPMVIAGTIIGASLFFFGEYSGFPLISTAPGWKVALCFVMGLLMIPAGKGLDIRGWSEMNSFNGPNWSLTFEYLGNILYAFIFRRLPTIALVVLCALSAILTLDLTLGWDIFGLFPVNEIVSPDGTVVTVGGPKYCVIGGWTLDAQQMYIGFTRLLYPFLCGLIISRILPKRITKSNPSGSPINIRGGFWVASLILIVIFSIPCIGGKDCFANGLYQAICICLIFPIVVLIGAGGETTDPTSTKICKVLGELSYPLYITHYPVMYMQMAWVGNHPDALLWQHIVLNIGVVAISIILAWTVYKVYDLPVRQWLTEKILKKAK